MARHVRLSGTAFEGPAHAAGFWPVVGLPFPSLVTTRIPHRLHDRAPGMNTQTPHISLLSRVPAGASPSGDGIVVGAGTGTPWNVTVGVPPTPRLTAVAFT